MSAARPLTGLRDWLAQLEGHLAQPRPRVSVLAWLERQGLTTDEAYAIADIGVSAGLIALTHDGSRPTYTWIGRPPSASAVRGPRLVNQNAPTGTPWYRAFQDRKPAPKPVPKGTEGMTRDTRRSRRKRAVRARTISVKRMTKRELELGRMLFPETDYEKPKTRGECAEGMRPCPYVSCKYHLYLDVQARTGAIKLNFPDLEVEDMRESCSLDISDRGGTTLEEVGAIMNLTRERVRQLEVDAFAAIEHRRGLADYATADGQTRPGRRRLPLIDDGAFTRDVEEAALELGTDGHLEAAE